MFVLEICHKMLKTENMMETGDERETFQYRFLLTAPESIKF